MKACAIFVLGVIADFLNLTIAQALALECFPLDGDAK